jgi:branched-chain amino acid transport system permease protein
MKKRNTILTLSAVVVLVILLFIANNTLDSYILRILNLCAIYTVLGLSMNLINGFTGLFSLGHAGFMAVGAYVTALFTMPLAVKQMNFFMAPLIAPFDKMVWPFLPSLLLAGVLSAVIAFLIGAPVLRLKGDYLAIATLGFGEIIRVVFTNTQSLTNGALGLKSIPQTTNLWWSFGTAAVTIFVLVSLINSSYGRAFKAIREDEIAAESMGIYLFKHKVMSFAIGAFFAGIGGGLLGNLIGAIDPLMFRFTTTYNILLIIVLGGMGSITGTVISAVIITAAQEILRFLDEAMIPGIPALPGLRMVVFSVLLMVVVLFFRNGLMGTREFSWDKLFGKFSKKPLAKGGNE